jgi:hypothetical protein
MREELILLEECLKPRSYPSFKSWFYQEYPHNKFNLPRGTVYAPHLTEPLVEALSRIYQLWLACPSNIYFYYNDDDIIDSSFEDLHFVETIFIKDPTRLLRHLRLNSLGV